MKSMKSLRARYKKSTASCGNNCTAPTRAGHCMPLKSVPTPGFFGLLPPGPRRPRKIAGGGCGPALDEAAKVEVERKLIAAAGRFAERIKRVW